MIFDPFHKKKRNETRPGFDDIMPQTGDPRIPRNPEIPDEIVPKPPGVLDEPIDLDDVNPSLENRRKRTDLDIP